MSLKTSRKSNSNKEVLSWLNNADTNNLSTELEHNINTTHHQWTSEPELWMYQPGCEPKHVNLRINSTEYDSTEYEDSLDENDNNNNTSTIYNRKAIRRHRMKYGKKLESSKSDSYHKKYVWDMVLNERAVSAITKQYKKLGKKKAAEYNRKFSVTNSECSQSSRTMSTSLKIKNSNHQPNDLLMRSISQRYRHGSKEHSSAIFAHIDAHIERSGRHPAKSSSKESEHRRKQRLLSSRKVKDTTEVDQIQPTLSLKNNNNSVGGTNSYFATTSGSGYPTPQHSNYPPTQVPYLDPMILAQALVVNNLFQQQVPLPTNPYANYQSANIYTPYTTNLTSVNGGYPVFQQELLSQMLGTQLGEKNSVATNNTNRKDLVVSSEESEDIRPSRHAIDDESNDLHCKNTGHRIRRTKTYFSEQGCPSNFDVLPAPKPSTAQSSVQHYLTKLKTCVETLKSSGWYWNKLNGEAAMRTVEKKGLGAFLIRDSSHQKYLFTLTVHTTNGPTNVRILFKNGKFGLDCDGSAKDSSGIRFNCVVAMVAHYVSNSKKYKKIEHKKNKKDKNTRSNQQETNSDSIALLLLAPCRKQPPSLQHLARVAVHKKLSKKSARISGLKLEDLVRDDNLIQYCRKYPYNV